MASLHLARSLIGSNDPEHDGHENMDEGELGVHDDTQALRIASIFVILASGLLGGLPPLFMKLFRDPDSTLNKLIRAFAAGVILALALVHIIPEAVEEMADLGGIEYPLGGTCVLGGVVLMVMLEHFAHIVNNSSEAAGSTAAPKAHAHCASKVSSKSAINPDNFVEEALPPAAMSDAPVKQPAVSTMSSSSAGLGHSHVCVSRGAASNWLVAGTLDVMGNVRLKIVAYLFEVGCIFHSFIIGLSLGVNQTDLTEVRSLLIALAFHQWLEGISLASVVLRGGFSRGKGALMILTYSLTCPIGIAIGMAIAKTYDGESERARGVQGAFNGVSGGMLLYIALVQLVAEDMGRLVPGRDSAGARLSCFAALCAGAGCMCLLAVWA